MLIKQMMERWGVTEQLKAENQMGWGADHAAQHWTNKVMDSRHPPLARDDFKWADAVTVYARRVCTVTI